MPAQEKVAMIDAMAANSHHGRSHRQMEISVNVAMNQSPRNASCFALAPFGVEGTESTLKWGCVCGFRQTVAGVIKLPAEGCFVEVG
jgi:hypothetical protein